VRDEYKRLADEYRAKWLEQQARAQLAAPVGVPDTSELQRVIYNADYNAKRMLEADSFWRSEISGIRVEFERFMRAPLAAAPSPAPEHAENRTAGDKYRAELYDEVWQKARDMGYGNVTEALIALERQPSPDSDHPPCASAYMTADKRMLIFADKADGMEWYDKADLIPLYEGSQIAPASAVVQVPRELASRLTSTDNHVRQTARRELRNMLLNGGRV
jgi:hypothetical protein